MIDQIEAFANLKKGWNGYEANPPNSRCIRISKALYRAFKVKPKRITPSAIGGIAMLWDNLYLEVYNADGGVAMILGQRSFKENHHIMVPKTKLGLATFVNLFLLNSRS